MIPMENWHMLSDIDSESRLGTCTICGPDTRVRFRKHRNQWRCASSDRRMSEASRARASEWMKVYSREQRRRNRGIKYGITPDDVAAMLVAQNGRCAICGEPEGERLLAVDHCHTTGRVRGLFCSPCNLGIGLLKDDPDLMLRAVTYLT